METTSIPTGVYSYTRHHTEQHRSSLGRARPLQKSEDTRYQGHEERTAQGEPGGGWGLREGKGAGEERWTVEAAGWPGAARGTTTGYGGEQSPEVRAGRGPAAGTDTAHVAARRAELIQSHLHPTTEHRFEESFVVNEERGAVRARNCYRVIGKKCYRLMRVITFLN